MNRSWIGWAAAGLVLPVIWLAAAPAAVLAADAETVRGQLSAIIGQLPADAATPERPMTDARVDLGRTLYYDARLSKNHDISCNSCHQLGRFGVDGEPTSPGHKGQRGGRNSPTVYNAALHLAQFWDGREPDVEAQAKGPVLNPIEMAMPSEEAVVAVLQSIPGYRPLFEAAFPGVADPITYDNMATAIGAFERGLMTPSAFDRFLAGDDGALGPDALAGASLFVSKGCVTCHTGPAVGGGMYRKIGQVEPYPTEDLGRYEVTQQDADRYVFKVPSLRNISETGPYFHDGSVTSLDQAVLLMGRHQLGLEIAPADRAKIVAFLESLEGNISPAYIAEPKLPASGPETPKPDPS